MSATGQRRLLEIVGAFHGALVEANDGNRHRSFERRTHRPGSELPVVPVSPAREERCTRRPDGARMSVHHGDEAHPGQLVHTGYGSRLWAGRIVAALALERVSPARHCAAASLRAVGGVPADGAHSVADVEHRRPLGAEVVPEAAPTRIAPAHDRSRPSDRTRNKLTHRDGRGVAHVENIDRDPGRGGRSIAELPARVVAPTRDFPRRADDAGRGVIRDDRDGVRDSRDVHGHRE
jgi:hypothetical protein